MSNLRSIVKVRGASKPGEHLTDTTRNLNNSKIFKFQKNIFSKNDWKSLITVSLIEISKQKSEKRIVESRKIFKMALPSILEISNKRE